MNDNKTDKAISMEDFEQSKKDVLTTSTLLENVKADELSNALVAGFNTDGSFRFYSNFDDPRALVFLLEAFKQAVVEQTLYPRPSSDQ